MSTSGISTLDTSSDATHSKDEVSPNSDGGSGHSPPKAGMETGPGSTEAGGSSECPAEQQEVGEGGSGTKNTSAGTVSEDKDNPEGGASPAEHNIKLSCEVSEEQNNSCKSLTSSIVKEMESGSPDLNHTKDNTTDDSGEHSLEDLKDNSQGSSSDSDNQNKEVKENTSAADPETSNGKSTETNDNNTQETASQENSSNRTCSTSTPQAGKTSVLVGGSAKQRHISSSGSSSSSSSDEDKLAETLTITETPEISGTGGHLTSEGDESLESSPEPHICPPPHYLTANNGMLC